MMQKIECDYRKGAFYVRNPDLWVKSEPYQVFELIHCAVQHDFGIDSATEAAIIENASSLKNIDPHRIFTSLERLLTGPAPERAFELMFHLNILKEILPEVHALYGCEQQPDFHPEGDVFRHTMLMLSKMAHPTVELAWSVLLHDIGKPASRTVRNGVIHFYGHESIGAKMADNLLTHLGAPEKLIRHVVTAVAGHMRFADVDKMRRTTWRKLMNAPTFATEMELHRIDCSACHGMLQNYILMLDRIAAAEKEPALPPPLINGDDLLAMGFSTGPDLGTLLNEIRNLQLNGELGTRNDALQYIQSKGL